VADDEPADEDIGVLNAEVTALHILRELDLSADQLGLVAKAAREVETKQMKQTSPPKVSAAYRATLVALRDALARGDEEKSADYRARLDELHDTEDPDLRLTIDISKAARKNAQLALRVLSVRQLGAFTANLELADPTELWTAGLKAVRGLTDAEVNEEVGQLTDEMTWLVAGTEAAGARIKERLTALLQQARKLKDADFERQLPELEEKGRNIIGQVDNMTLLTRNIEHGMAEFLSNPRLRSAIESVRKTPRKPANHDAAAKPG
jgi:hypothetical protein